MKKVVVLILILFCCCSCGTKSGKAQMVLGILHNPVGTLIGVGIGAGVAVGAVACSAVMSEKENPDKGVCPHCKKKLTEEDLKKGTSPFCDTCTMNRE